MIIPPLRYLRPSTLAEAVEMLSTVDGATVLAGGQTLLNVLKLDLVQPAALVDVHRLDELHGIEVTPTGTLVIGAATTYAEIAASPVVQETQPSVAAMAAGLVDRQVRNRGTIGGNCCVNDPTNNFPPLLVALNAYFRTVGATGPQGWRSLSSDTFFTGALSTTLEPCDVLTSVHIPRLPTSSRVVHRHLQVGADSWAMARAVVRLDVTDGTVSGARIALGAVPGSPLRLTTVEEALTGHRLDSSLIEAAAAAFDKEDVQTVGDVHSSAEYRREMAKVQLRRAVRDAVEGSNP